MMSHEMKVAPVTELKIGNSLEDQNVLEIIPLISPREIKKMIPVLNPEIVQNSREMIGNILHGKDPRKLVIVGPCSIHDEDAATEYAHGIKDVQAQTKDELFIVMRAYFEKPRTSLGWTGLLYDPRLDGSEDLQEGLIRARKIFSRLNEMELPCATEILDPNTPQYLADFISWGAIGARTVESQVHRQLASGLSMPIGLKNNTSGNIEAATNAMTTVSMPHTFPGVDQDGRSCVVKTKGNKNAHIVLRGGNGINYDRATVEATRIKCNDLSLGISQPIIIDCSHGNSNKNHNNQPLVAIDVAEQIRDGQRGIAGIMIESNILEGNQKWCPGAKLAYGKSITDACIDLPTTKTLLVQFAKSIRIR